MGKVLLPEGEDVMIPRGHSNTEFYHTRMCYEARAIENLKEVDIAVARDWKGYRECKVCTGEYP